MLKVTILGGFIIINMIIGTKTVNVSGCKHMGTKSLLEPRVAIPGIAHFGTGTPNP